MNFPENLFYTKDHEWVRFEGDTAIIGITDFAQSELGDIVFVEVDSVGDTLSYGNVFGSVEAVKTVSELYMPVDGEVLELNAEIESNPETVNSDPYGNGWMIKVKLTNPESREGLMNAAEYRALTGH